MAALLVSLAVMSVLMGARASGLAASGPAGEGSRARVSRRTVRSRDSPLGVEDGAGLAAAELRHPGPAEIPPEEIQGSDDRGRRVPTAVCRCEPAGAGRRRGSWWTRPGWPERLRCEPGSGRSRPDAAAASTALRGPVARWVAAGFSASPARARKRPSASTTAVRITTSGPSCSPTRRLLLVEWAVRYRAAAAVLNSRVVAALAARDLAAEAHSGGRGVGPGGSGMGGQPVVTPGIVPGGRGR